MRVGAGGGVRQSVAENELGTMPIGAVFPMTGTTVILTGFLQALGRGNDSFVVAIAQAVFLLSSA